MPEEAKITFIEICSIDELLPGERLFIEVGDQPILLLNIDGTVYAIGDVCTHDNGPLGEGELDGCEIVCPRHGARFDVRDGRATRLPALKPIPSYPARVIDGRVEIGFPTE